MGFSPCPLGLVLLDMSMGGVGRIWGLKPQSTSGEVEKCPWKGLSEAHKRPELDGWGVTQECLLKTIPLWKEEGLQGDSLGRK